MSKGKRKPKEPRDEIMELSGALEPEEEEETEDGVREQEEEGKEGQVEPGPEAEPSKESTAAEEEPGAEPSPEEEEAAAAVAEAAEAARQATLEREKALRDEVTSLRGKVRELTEAQQRLRAPLPYMAPPETVSQKATLPPTGPQPIQFEMSEEGKFQIDPAQLEPLIRQEVQSRVAEATRPDPQQQFRSMLDAERSGWIGHGDEAQERAQIASRTQQAVDFLEIASEHHARSTGFQFGGASLSRGIDELQNAGVLDRFRTYFPEVENPRAFIHAFFAPGHPEDRIRGMRDYMDAVWKANKPEVRQSVEEDGAPSAAIPTPEGTVTQLAQRPRSMARKGSPAPAQTGQKSRIQALAERASVNPMSLSPEEWNELDAGLEKHGAA